MRGRHFQCSNSLLDSFPFQKFMVGLLCRMGKVVLTGRIHWCRCVEINFSELLGRYGGYNSDLGRKRKAIMWSEFYEWVKIANYGKLDIAALHVVVPLMGWFKWEEGERNIFLELPNRMGTSDLWIRWWVERLSSVLVREGASILWRRWIFYVTIFSQCGVVKCSDRDSDLVATFNWQGNFSGEKFINLLVI